MPEQIKNTCYVIAKLHKFSKSRIIITMLSVFCDLAEQLIFNILFFPLIYNAITNHYSAEKLFMWGSGLILVLLAAVAFRMWRDQCYLPKSNLQIKQGFEQEILTKSFKIDLIQYSDSKAYDRYLWVMQNAAQYAVGVLDTIFRWIERVLMILIVGSIMVALKGTMLLFVIIPIAINLIMSSIQNKVRYRYQQEKLEDEKTLSYINRTFYLREYAQEIKTTNISDCLLDQLHEHVTKLRRKIKHFGFRLGFIQTVENSVIESFSSAGALLYLAYLALVRSELSVSDVVVLSSSIWQISSAFLSLLNILPQLQEHNQYLRDYREFIELKSEIVDNIDGKQAQPSPNAITIENVSFSYPQTDGVLKNINMDIKAGEKIAIVGHNGAGKSSLIKLILRLYLPTSGEIRMDDTEAGQYNLFSYRNRFATVFQDFQLYATDLRKNIWMNQKEAKGENDKKLIQILEKVGLEEKVDTLNQGLSSRMTHEFDDNGVELSGGESQKVAIARVYCKDAGVIILDEPSAALDPISEHNIFQHMLEAAGKKTVILISHRLSATKDADKIYYLEHGEILEQGSHKELMQKNGKYAEMFVTQAKKYQL